MNTLHNRVVSCADLQSFDFSSSSSSMVWQYLDKINTREIKVSVKLLSSPSTVLAWLREWRFMEDMVYNVCRHADGWPGLSGSTGMLATAAVGEGLVVGDCWWFFSPSPLLLSSSSPVLLKGHNRLQTILQGLYTSKNCYLKFHDIPRQSC